MEMTLIVITLKEGNDIRILSFTRARITKGKGAIRLFRTTTPS